MLARQSKIGSQVELGTNIQRISNQINEAMGDRDIGSGYRTSPAVSAFRKIDNLVS